MYVYKIKLRACICIIFTKYVVSYIVFKTECSNNLYYYVTIIIVYIQ